MTGQATTQATANTADALARPAPPYQQAFPGRADQLSQVRREIAGYLENCPVADGLVLVTDELAANAIVHSRSRGSTFHVRCQLSPRAARIEVEAMGGPWRSRNAGDRPHGLDIVQALSGPAEWGIQVTGTGGRTVWARLTW